MARAALALLILAAGGCAPARDADRNGNIYPAECTVAATISEPASRIGMDPVILDAMLGEFNKHEFGLWLPGFNNGLPTIFYDETSRGWALADVMRHEGCHGVRDRLTGDPHWHPY